MMFKDCSLSCFYQHEGFCTLEIVEGVNPNICKAKSDDDLVDEDEYEKI